MVLGASPTCPEEWSTLLCPGFSGELIVVGRLKWPCLRKESKAKGVPSGLKRIDSSKVRKGRGEATR